MTNVAVVVATRNRAAQLAELLDALRVQSLPPTEVVIVDDASDDRTAELLEGTARSASLPLRVIRRRRPAGPATAREAGWRAAEAELIAFTDDDCIPDPGWLAACVSAWKGAPEGSNRFVQGRTEPPPGVRVGPFSRTIEVTRLDPSFQTCNILYPRELLERVDGFDTETFGLAPGGEDADLAWRAIEAGAKPSFAPEAIVRHAVNVLGPIGKLRVAARWTKPLRAYAMHEGLRRAHFTHRIFWKDVHWWLLRAALALALPGRRHALRAWLAYPYLRDIWARGRVHGGGPFLVPYFVLHDLIEVYAVARAAIRTRTPMI
jgi:GT2 family glycosyltransferase